jgi:hypothetical protein
MNLEKKVKALEAQSSHGLIEIDRRSSIFRMYDKICYQIVRKGELFG